MLDQRRRRWADVVQIFKVKYQENILKRINILILIPYH